MIAREAVCNAALHGHPTQISVGMEYTAREVVLTVSDDGCGFDPRQAESQSDHHFGLKGMRERASRWGGKFRLTSATGSGARVEARLARRSCFGFRAATAFQADQATGDQSVIPDQ
jgi:signal transduction histidine kinase